MTKEQYNKELIEEGWRELTPEYLEAKRLEAIERDKARNKRKGDAMNDYDRGFHDGTAYMCRRIDKIVFAWQHTARTWSGVTLSKAMTGNDVRDVIDGVLEDIKKLKT